ncbi:DcuC family C4-dicarboxylate transporter [Buttiauxella sp. JUb87]|uniref:C4-dicarboxylate transporter DcuC n=1 Tax=Buttiauxella sp. JUb87 TaxID=2485129 RepID=UPI00105BBBCA|nr:C4-dicarboxylate transporter DcuC [Buttiauxella sp. JUb87]TDN54677.1 DcuC family C4-dicarboxylate transporter [Buttiauxella sp. JUb87]
MQNAMFKKAKTILFIMSCFLALWALKYAFGDKTFVLAASFLVIILVSAGIAKQYYAQSIILTGGIFLLFITALYFPSVSITKAVSGSRFIDIFIEIKSIFSDSIAKLGLIIMVIAGFSRYMNDIGASAKLVELCIQPLKKINAKYILLGSCYILMQILALFISSPSGLALLMLTTLYPVLRSIGCSKAAVASVIASGICIDYGPAATGSVLISEITGYDLFSVFVDKQLPIVAILFVAIGVLHMFMQAYWDRKEGITQEQDENEVSENEIAKHVPTYYALLPIVPMILLFTFSSLVEENLPKFLQIKIDVVSAIILSFFIAFITDTIRTFDLKKSTDKVIGLFDQMGQSFITVVSILLCAQVLVAGIIKIGFIDTLFSFIPSNGHFAYIMVIIFSLLIFFGSLIMGTGTVFNAFAPLSAEVAKGAGISVFKMLVPLHFSASLGRTFSPISGVIIAVSGFVGVTPFQIIKRNCIQLGVGYVLMLGLSMVML